MSSLRDTLRKWFGGKPAGETFEPGETEEYVEEITEKLTAQGYINREEAGMIRRVVELRDRTAAEIMVPRSEIFAISTQEPLGRVIELIQERNHSRIPIYEGTIDNILGILYTKDMLKLWGKPSDSREYLTLLRPPTIIPEGKPAADLLAKFKKERVHIAIVIDEFGGTSGLVTLEDVIEEIFGDIQDEYDEEESAVQPLPDGTVLADASMPFNRAIEMFQLSEPTGERDYDTLGGFLSHLAGRIPRRGETLTYGDRVFTIEAANARRVFKVRVSPRITPDLGESGPLP